MGRPSSLHRCDIVLSLRAIARHARRLRRHARLLGTVADLVVIEEKAAALLRPLVERG
jgi:hypothetical protein